jgi:ATP-dependent DNA helicase RecG
MIMQTLSSIDPIATAEYLCNTNEHQYLERKDNNDVYRRISDSNFGPLNNDEIDRLRHDKSLRRFEEQSRLDFNPNDIDAATLGRYKSTLRYKGTNEELLVKRNLAYMDKGKLVYRNCAILLFANDPDKYIPSSYVSYIRYNGSEARPGKDFNVTKDVRLEGNIPMLVDATKEFIFASLDDFFFLDMSSGKFISISEYPEDAWLEGVVNALFHRSYNLQGNCIYIKHFDDRLEISNSGPLPAQVNVSNIRTQRFTRNPRIGRVLAEMGYVRELNEGVNRIYSSMEESMLSEPEYSDNNDTVILKLTNNVAGNEKTIPNTIIQEITEHWKGLKQTERLILQHLFKNSSATIAELAEYSSVTEQALRGYLKGFIARGWVVKDSSKQRDKNAKYRFRKIQST